MKFDLRHVTLSNGDTAVFFNSKLVLSSSNASKSEVLPLDVCMNLAKILGVQMQNIMQDVPAKADWDWNDIALLLPPADSEWYMEFRSYDELANEYGWSEAEKQHAKNAMRSRLSNEAVIPFVNGRELRANSISDDLEYVRVTQVGQELAYWKVQELQFDPEKVIRAIFESAETKHT